MNKIRSFTAVIAAILLLLTSCGGKYNFPESTEEDLAPVLYIGGEDVPMELYRYFFMNFKLGVDGGDNAYWQTHDADSAFADIDDDTRASILRMYAVMSLCGDYGIDTDSDEIKKAVDKSVEDYIENEMGGRDEYLAGLSEAYMNHSVFRFVMTEFECESRLYDALVDAGKINTDSAAVAAAITDGEFCCAKQVFISNDAGDDIEENRKKAEDILLQAHLGVDFDELVARYGEDPEMIVNPTGRYFAHGELIEEFEDAAFALEVGEMSCVVESPLGFHIILRCPIDPAYVAANISDLGEAYLTSKFWQIVNERSASLTVAEAPAWSALSMSDFSY